MTDTIPLGLDLVDGSVYVGGKLATYSFANRILTVNAGNIAPGESVEITFKVTVSESARGSTIENVAYLSGGNSGQLIAPDNGVKVDEGTPIPNVSKSSSVSEASVGESVIYTVTATNSIKATADWRGVTLTDVIPDGFDFKHGSVYIGGASATYSYSGRALTVRLGDLIPGESAVIIQIALMELQHKVPHIGWQKFDSVFHDRKHIGFVLFQYPVVTAQENILINECAEFYFGNCHHF